MFGLACWDNVMMLGKEKLPVGVLEYPGAMPVVSVATLGRYRHDVADPLRRLRVFCSGDGDGV